MQTESIFILAEVVFGESKKIKVNFPIKNSYRLSFWLPDMKGSMFSEIQIHKEQIELQKPAIVRIMLPNVGSIINKISIGSDFRLGTFPVVLAKGKVIEILANNKTQNIL